MLNSIVYFICQLFKNVEGIYIYGSYARGTETESSDIDVCVKMPEGSQINRYCFALNKLLTKITGKEVHVVFCTKMNAWCEKKIYPIAN